MGNKLKKNAAGKAVSIPVDDGAEVIGRKLSFAASEAYKLLRTNLMFALPDEGKCRVIGVTSALRDEGKSTLSINLCYTIAQTGKRVLLIDGDMRLPVIAARTGLPGKPGLSNLLAGLCSEKDVVQASELADSMFVITAGDVPPNPSELLASARMEAALTFYAQQFDFIVLDMPPVSAVADSLVVTKLIDGMLVAVRRDYCERKVLDDTLRSLRYLDARILGFVMTYGAVEKSGYHKKYGKRRGKYGYGYSYGYGYGYENAAQQTTDSAAEKGKPSGQNPGV